MIQHNLGCILHAGPSTFKMSDVSVTSLFNSTHWRGVGRKQDGYTGPLTLHHALEPVRGLFSVGMSW